MINAVGHTGTHHAELIRHPCRVRQPVGDPQAALAVLFPCPLRGEDGRVELAHRRDHPAEALGHGLPGKLLQGRLWIEEVDVAGAALHEQEDHALGPACLVRRLGRQGRKVGRCRGAEGSAAAEADQGQAAEAGTAAGEHLATGEERHGGRFRGDAMRWAAGRAVGRAFVEILLQASELLLQASELLLQSR